MAVVLELIDAPADRLDLGSFDLNLLFVLHALLTSRNITQAGNRVRLSQPATSRALTRLREMFGDELLIRRNQLFELTPLAEKLAPKVETTLLNIGSLFGTPLQPIERFRLAVPDHLALLVTEVTRRHLHDIAPQTVLLPSVTLANALNQLECGELDLALGLTDEVLPGFYRRGLPPVLTLCVCRPEHPALKARLAYAELNCFPSIRIGPTNNGTLEKVYDGLAALGPKGAETLTVPDIHTAALLAQATDAILILPAPSARYLAERYRLETFPPGEGSVAPPYRISLIWHERWHRNALHADIRAMIASCLHDDTLERFIS